MHQAGASRARRELMLRRGFGAGLPRLDAASDAAAAAAAGLLPLHTLYRFCMLDPPVCPRGRPNGANEENEDFNTDYADALQIVRRHTAGPLALKLTGACFSCALD